MKKTLLLIATLLLAHAAWSQEDVKYVDDEECGCELVFINGIQTTQSGDRFGFKREDGTVIVPNKYLFVDKFHGDYCKVYMNYDSCGLINRDGVEIIPCIYKDVFYPTDSLIMVLRDTLYGYFDTLGRQRIPFRYPAASSFSEGMAVVAEYIDSEFVAYGFIDHFGNTVIKPSFQYALPFSEGYAVVKDYDRYGMIDRKGREVFPIKYEILTSMYEGHLFAGDDDGLALYNNRFEPLTKPVYTELVGKSEERILVKRDGKYGYLDNNGKEIIPCQYDNAGMFKESRAYVSRNGKWGIIDRMGNAVLPIEYDNSGYRGEAYIYHDGLALVEKDHLYGYADINGNLVIYPCFQNAYQFSDGLAPVFIGQWGYINTKGDFFIPPVFDIAGPFSWGRAEVIYHGEIHKMNTEGQCVKNCKNAPKSWR
ncbi:MAG: WG repeat-containing protein [Bacteroidales bacterium]|nr:WG repeat-containing protein [Bacteroidales bacterium]